MIESHFGFCEVEDGHCVINFYHSEPDGRGCTEFIANMKEVTKAQEMCDNLNRVIPLISPYGE